MSDGNKIKERDLKKMKGKTICRFPSNKPTPRTIYTEGAIENAFCYHLEADLEVREYKSQPRGFYYWIGPVKHVYTPDFLAYFNLAPPKYYEVKELKFINEEFLKTFEIIQEQSLLEGYELELVTDEFIFQEPLFINLQHLHRARNNGFCSEKFKSLALSALSQVPCLTMRELLDYAEEPNGIGMVYKLIQLGMLSANLNEELFGPDCLVSLKND